MSGWKNNCYRRFVNVQLLCLELIVTSISDRFTHIVLGLSDFLHLSHDLRSLPAGQPHRELPRPLVD